MSLLLRRLLNYLPTAHGGSREQYLKSSWHKPTPFDQWRSQAPFRPASTLRANHFGRGLRRQRIVRGLIRWTIAFGLAWVVLESGRAVM